LQPLPLLQFPRRQQSVYWTLRVSSSLAVKALELWVELRLEPAGEQQLEDFVWSLPMVQLLALLFQAAYLAYLVEPACMTQR
jgi:hypothetical protein